MPKTINNLSARKVQTIERPGLYADGGNLYLVVEASGAKRWAFIFQQAGRRREMGLGPLNSVSLQAAREAAADARLLVAKGIDPIAARKAERAKGVTFGGFATELFETLKPRWKNPKHVYQWQRSIDVHCASLHSIPLTDITTTDVLNVLKPLWSTIPETAERTRQRIQKILDAAEGQEFRSGPNPARWAGCLEHCLPKRQKLTQGHHPAMPAKDVAAFMTLVAKRPAMAARALEFTILTAARTGEVLGARWQEFDLQEGVWRVPANRMKGAVEHRVPLSGRAIAVLKSAGQVAGPDQLVFGDPVSGHLLSNMAMRALMKRMGFEQFAVHGFRSTFRDWCGEETDFAWDVIEIALAHRVGTDVHRAYRRGDALEKRRELMEAWASFCAGVIAEPAALAA